MTAKVRSTFQHAPGSAWCDGDPLACWLTPDGGGAGTLFTGVHLDAAAQTWTAAATFPLPAGYLYKGREAAA